MSERRNHYRVLHLQPDAPIAVVKVNYRTMMHKLGAHPDLGGTTERAAQLNLAYCTLSDPERRAAYDRELLSLYDLGSIAEGRSKPPARRAPEPWRSINRRNYYRVLQSQRDAPLAILQASHRALRAENPADADLFDEALTLVSDPNLRESYDRLLEVCSHLEALARMRIEPRSTPRYEPLIRSFCAFCKSPHACSQEEEAAARCVECQSPLFPPPSQLLGLARRAVTRVSRDDPVTLHLDWPSSGFQGRLGDLSPTGMSCETEARLDPNDVVKVAASGFDAVGAVAHARRDGRKTTVGMRFLTVGFSRDRGNFRSLKV